MSTFRVVVDRGRCTGIGICESLNPERFEVDDDGSLIIHAADVLPADRETATTAVESCPARALTLIESTVV